MKPLKSIWKRRNRYGWLIAEIIVASVIAFIVLDPIVVSIYDAHRPYNYDVDRLVMVQLRQLDRHNSAYNAERATNMKLLESDLMNAIPNLAELPEVEKVIPLPHRGFGSGDDSYESIGVADSSKVRTFRATFIPGTDFFTTFGFKAAEDIPGNPSIEQMNDMQVDFEYEMICTRSMARLLYGDEHIAMSESRIRYESRDSMERKYHIPVEKHIIVGIIEDARAWGDRAWPLIRFYADPLSHSIRWNKSGLNNIILRLRPGESASNLAHRFNKDPELQALCRVGMLEFDNARPYAEVNGASSLLSPKERYRNVLVIFFAINIFLGVFGTFWLLTRKRTEEAGIMRAFGASPAAVRRMLYIEGFILALISALIGCGIAIYFFYNNPERMEYGLSGFKDIPMEQLPAMLHTWVGDFWLHMGVVSAVVCAIMLIVVFAGIAIPAWKLSRVNPVEALADE